MTKMVEVRQMSADQAKKHLAELYKERLNLRFQKAGGQLEDTSQLRKTRRLIARLKTHLRQQQLQNAK